MDLMSDIRSFDFLVFHNLTIIDHTHVGIITIITGYYGDITHTCWYYHNYYGDIIKL